MFPLFEYDLVSFSIEYKTREKLSTLDISCKQEREALVEHYHLKARPAQSVVGSIQQEKRSFSFFNHVSLSLECPYCQHSQKALPNKWYMLLDQHGHSLCENKIEITEWLMARYLGLSSAGARLSLIAIPEAKLSEIKDRSGCVLYRCKDCRNFFAVSFELKESCRETEGAFLDRSIFREFDITVRKTCFDSSISFALIKNQSPLWTYHFRADGSVDLNQRPIRMNIVDFRNQSPSTWKVVDCAIPRIKCDDLLNSLTKIRQGSVLEALLKQINLHLGCCDTQHLISLLAYINRYRDYPESFYQEALRIPKDGSYIKLKYDDLLPSTVHDLDPIVKTSVLPNAKSIRRTLFRYPRLISLAMNWTKPPFKNIDILSELLETQAAFPWLEAYSRSQNLLDEDGETILDYMQQKYGDVAIWHHLKSIGFEKSPFVNRGLNLAIKYLNDNPLAHLNASHYTKDLSLKGEFGLLTYLSDIEPEDLFLDPENKWWFFSNYEYGKEIKSLQHFGDEISIELPLFPFEVHCAGIILSNCLAYYSTSILNRTTIFLIKKQGRIVGALEVYFKERSILQASGPYNRPLETMPDVLRVVQSWKKENMLYGPE